VVDGSVLTSVVVGTGVLISTVAVEGLVTSVEVLAFVLLIRSVDDSVPAFVIGTVVPVTSTAVDVVTSVEVPTGVVLSTELLEGLLTSVEVLSEVELAGSVDVGVLSSVVVGTRMLVTSTVVVGVVADNNLLHCVRISLEVSNELILTRILDDGVLPSVLSVIGLFSPSALLREDLALSSFPTDRTVST
jgi:hypothetical protein